MSTRSIVSPDDQSATFVELFFDLVFVFSLTQVVSYLAHHLTWTGLAQSVLVFWMVWWAWTQFTWALNAANTEHPAVRLGTLVATAIAFLMAVGVPEAFNGKGLWFGATYVLVRIVGLTVYGYVAQANESAHHTAVRTFALASTGGLAAVLAGGIVGGSWQAPLWMAAVGLDVVAAVIGGRQESWHIHPEHFVERHGLFVIIALGEGLIVAAAGLTTAVWTVSHAALAVLAVALSCAFWWTYFAGPKEALEEGLAATPPARRGAVARDAFSLLHFPLLFGVITFAVAVELAVEAPGEPLATPARVALAVSPLLFLGGTAAAVGRCAGSSAVPRLAVGSLTTLAVVALAGVPASASLGVALAGVTAVILIEGRGDASAVA